MTNTPQNNNQNYVDFISRQVQKGHVAGKPPEDRKPVEKK